MIEAFIGMNGAGKTAMAIKVARELAARHHVPIHSNLHADGLIPVENYEQLSSLRHCIVVLDEILAIAGSRESRSLPRAIQLWLTTLRHSDVLLLWTSPSFERADVLLREVTRRIHYVQTLTARKPRERLWADTKLSVVLTRSAVHGEADGWPKVSLLNVKSTWGTFSSHGDIAPFD